MWREENGKTPRQTLEARQEPTTNSTPYDTGPESSLGHIGERSHHCAITATLKYTRVINMATSTVKQNRFKHLGCLPFAGKIRLEFKVNSGEGVFVTNAVKSRNATLLLLH